MTTPEANKEPTENETELRERLEMILPCISCGVQAATEDGFGYCTCGNKEKVDSAMSILTSDKQQLLKELMEHKAYHRCEGGWFEYVPLSVIQNELEGLEQ